MSDKHDWRVPWTDDEIEALTELGERCCGAGIQSLEAIEEAGLVLDNLDDPWQKVVMTLHSRLVDLQMYAEPLFFTPDNGSSTS